VAALGVNCHGGGPQVDRQEKLFVGVAGHVGETGNFEDVVFYGGFALSFEGPIRVPILPRNPLNTQKSTFILDITKSEIHQPAVAPLIAVFA